MTRDECYGITLQRLGEWGRRCRGHHATPLLRIVTDRDQQSGVVHLIVPVELPADYDLVAIMAAVADRLANGQVERVSGTENIGRRTPII